VVGFQSIIRLVLLELTRNIQTAGLLTFTIYMLTEHPEILAKLREEILRIVGPTQRPTFDNFRDMKYLRVSNTVQSLLKH
jgi:cytochrome P450